MRLPQLVLAAFLSSTSLATADVKVMASIKPIHSLVASVMQGVGTPGLLVDGNNSPHTYTLKPSDAAALEQAEVIFWVGHELEAFLEKPLEALGGKATTQAMLDVDGITKLAPREGHGFDGHAHDHEAEAEGEEIDAHAWLDPQNAKSMLQAIATTLSKVDSANAAAYAENAKKAATELDQLTSELTATLAPTNAKKFILFHDAYQYFEKRFGLKAAGAISINPENPPGAKAIADIKKRIAAGEIQCVFAEPQFDNKLVKVILEGSDVKSSTLDPLGATIEAGPAHYKMLLKYLAQNVSDCLQ